MTGIRNRIESGIERFARVVYHHRFKTLVMVLMVFAAMAFQIPGITIDTSTEGFLHEDDPTLLDYNAFRDQFGRDEVIIIAIKPRQVFDFEFLKKLKALHEELEENVPHVDDITSLINARNTRGKADELIVEDLLENWPETESDLAEIKERALSNTMYKNMLISEDAKFTTIVIRTHSHSSVGQDFDVMEEFEDGIENSPETGKDVDHLKPRYLTDRENSESVEAARRIAKTYETPEFQIFIAGSPVVTHFLKQAMMHDMRKFMALSVATIAVLLYVMFRRLSGVFLPLVVVILTLLSTLGIMAAAGAAIKVPTQILPSFLLAVCVGASVHVLAIFYHRFRLKPDKEDAIAYALGHSGLAIVMTSLTTASGLLSFSAAELAPIADIGIFAGIGILISLLYTIVMLPALIAVVPVRIKPDGSRKEYHENTFMDRVLKGIGKISTGHPYVILGVSAFTIVFTAIMASTIIFSHDPLRWFPSDNDIRVATEKIDHELHGTLSLEVIIDTGETNGLYDPDILNRLEEAADYAESVSYEDLFIGKAWSVTTILKEINQALNENRTDYYSIPQNRDLIAQEFLLFENSGSDDLEDVVDSQFSKARLTIKAPFKDAIQYGKFLTQAEQYFKESFPDAKSTLTGMMVLLARTISNAVVTLAKSYIIALVVITLLMIFLIGRVRIGLLSMVPNLAPILLTLGIMGAFSIHMDLFTMMVGSIAIGLAVDDTIHFMHNFRRYYEQSGDPCAAVYETLHTTGRAMLVTTVVLSIGFFIFTFATMKNLFNFGLLTAFTITMALVADYFIAPALMVVVNKKTATQPSKVTT
jgi:predicted RND superfamily exporter protein